MCFNMRTTCSICIYGYDALCLFFSMQVFFVTFCTEVIEGSLADKYGFCKQVYIIEIPSQLSWQQFWSVLKYDLGWLRQLCVCVFVVMLPGYNVESPAKLN